MRKNTLLLTRAGFTSPRPRLIGILSNKAHARNTPPLLCHWQVQVQVQVAGSVGRLGGWAVARSVGGLGGWAGWLGWAAGLAGCLGWAGRLVWLAGLAGLGWVGWLGWQDTKEAQNHVNYEAKWPQER